MYVAIVEMETPACSHDMAVEISLKATEKFRAMKHDGLIMKYFLSRDTGGGGGVYIWKSKEDADAWHTPEWSAHFEEVYGAKPEVTFYDSFVQVDNSRDKVFVDGTPQEHVQAD